MACYDAFWFWGLPQRPPCCPPRLPTASWAAVCATPSAATLSPAAHIVCENAQTNTHVSALTGDLGTFGLPALPPGRYRIRTDADGYQSVDIENLLLPVAGVLDLDLRLRPLSDVWERDQYRSVFLPGSRTVLVFYGPDVDTSRSSTFEPPSTSTGRLDTSISDVIPPQLISELPLQGRDVYTALVMEPGVASDTSTARGIGIAVNGQRPSSSNFLLDGSENNNSLLSGPLLTLPPEAVQEFRFSTGNFSAEYGRTAGFVVNAVTRSGGTAWHGIGYLDYNRAALNANDFQRNAATLGRLPFDQKNFGVEAGGRGSRSANGGCFSARRSTSCEAAVTRMHQTGLFRVASSCQPMSTDEFRRSAAAAVYPRLSESDFGRGLYHRHGNPHQDDSPIPGATAFRYRTSGKASIIYQCVWREDGCPSPTSTGRRTRDFQPRSTIAPAVSIPISGRPCRPP